MRDKPPTDPADHAKEFADGWVDRLENAVEGRMHASGVPEAMIGSSDYKAGVPWRVFFSHEVDGGGVAPGGRISVDSVVLNPDLYPVKEWAEGRLRHRVDAIIAHEYEEARGGSHGFAVEHAPETELPIEEKVRKLLRAIRRSEPGFRGGDPSRIR